MTYSTQIMRDVVLEKTIAELADDPIIDHERSKGMPAGMFIGKDGRIYGFDEEEAALENAKLAETIDHAKLAVLAEQMRAKQIEIEQD